MAASTSDKITAVKSDNINPVPTTVSSPRSIGGTTLSGVSFDGWPTVSKVHFITYRKTAAGMIDRTTQCDWEAILSGTTLGSLTLTAGTDAGNAVGDFIEMAPTAQYGQDMYDGLTQTLDNDGTLKSGIVGTSALADSAVTTGKIDSSDFDFLDVQMSANTGIGTSATNIVFQTVNADTAGIYNATTGIFTPKKSGVYIVDYSIFTTLGGSANMTTDQLTNVTDGTTVRQYGTFLGSFSGWAYAIQHGFLVNLVAGKQYRVRESGQTAFTASSGSYLKLQYLHA